MRSFLKTFQVFSVVSVIFVGIVGSITSTQVQAQAAARDVSQYNLQQGIGLGGYDPVAVFPEGSGAPRQGVMPFALAYRGVTYLFSSKENMEKFKSAPEKYEPTYGGWCAYAMASGAKVPIQPTVFTLHGNRAHYFVSSRAKVNFDSDVASYEMRADQNWKQISGENPRP